MRRVRLKLLVTGTLAVLLKVKEPGVHKHFPLDLVRPRGDTPPTQMLCLEMDSWGLSAPARVKEDETYRGLPHPLSKWCLQEPLSNHGRAPVAGSRRVSGSAGSHGPPG